MTGLSRDLLIPRDFVMLHLDLVDSLPSLESAILLLRIQYRAGDSGWWTVTKAQMQAETRLSERKLDRALKELLDAGYIEWVRAASQDSTRKVRVVYETEPTGRNVPNPVEDETSRTPSSKKSKTSSSSPAVRDIRSTEPQGFAEWWSTYPHKVGKQAAIKAYVKALVTAGSAECLLTGLQAQVEHLREKHKEGFCPHPSTWLNEGRWDDEITPRRQPARLEGETYHSYYARTGVLWVKEG